MQFTVSSRGRPIGVTDLGFKHFGGPARVGWFHPNAEGERLMPIVGARLPALKAFVERDRAAERAAGGAGTPLTETTEFADLAEAMHREDALDLTLQYEDGSLVPTEFVGLQDTERLHEFAQDAIDAADRAALACDEAFSETFDDDFVERLDAILEATGGELNEDAARELGVPVEALEFLLADEDDDWDEPWRPDEEPTEWPRYQIIVHLAAGVELP